jgi:hypothetical protein
MLRVGDLVTFNSYACKSWPHDYTRLEAVILVREPHDPDRSDIVLVLRRGKTELTHLRFLESLM